MFEKLKKIKIKGGCFDTETELELFKKDAISVVYGRNGSGKSTIARGIRNLAAENAVDVVADLTVSTQPAIPNGLNNSVFVFDEEFVDKQLKVAKDGIDTIVMLGEQVGLEEQILKAKQELAQFEQEKRALEAVKEKLENAEDEASPYYFLNLVRKGLTEFGGWLDTYNEIKGRNESYAITESQVLKLLKLEEPEETYDELGLRLKDDLKLYHDSTNARAVDWTTEPIRVPSSLDKITALLNTPLEKPEFSERERRLMSLIAMISQHPQHFSKKNTQEMLHERWEFCPLCLREIENRDRKDIQNTLKHILNKQSINFERNLSKYQKAFVEIDINFPEFPNFLYENEVYRAKVALEELNKIIAHIRRIIELRRRNIYEAIENPFSEEDRIAYSNAQFNWKKTRDELRRCVRKFNKAVNNRQGLENRIINENNLLARKQFAPVFESLQKAEERMHSTQNAIKVVESRVYKEQILINFLKHQKDRTDIALDYINQELQYVFYSDKKIVLEQGVGCYIMKVNGNSVKPNKISVGERNALALCYFFAALNVGKTEVEKYKSESLLVIDDPVSSFDYGNRVGVMSLLRYQFCNIVKGNANSRILVMSHDLRSVFDLIKVRNDILGKSDKLFLELVNRKLEEKRAQNEYKKLLDQVYAYAADDREKEYDEVLEISIGNIMRRMMEAFSSFCYNESFEKMVRKEDVLALIPDKKREYYDNLMWRLVLNGESHEEEDVYSLDNMVCFYTRKEKLNTAKSLLLFLMYINRPHLAAYLDDASLGVIKGWQKEEKGWIKKSESVKNEGRTQEK